MVPRNISWDMEQNIETLKYELRYVWDGEKLLVTSKYMWDHELFTSKSAMFTNCNEHNEVHYVAVKHGFWPTFFCKFEWQNFTFAQSYSQREGTRQGVTPVHALFSSSSDIIIIWGTRQGVTQVHALFSSSSDIIIIWGNRQGVTQVRVLFSSSSDIIIIWGTRRDNWPA